MRKLKLYFHFYRTKFLVPLAFATAILYVFRVMQLAIFSLITATIGYWFYERFINDKKKEKLYFYYNLGITETKLYLFVIFINLIVVMSINIYFK